jgi:hypothetical protein
MVPSVCPVPLTEAERAIIRKVAVGLWVFTVTQLVGLAAWAAAPA